LFVAVVILLLLLLWGALICGVMAHPQRPLHIPCSPTL
jgi:hypothetical protein